MHVSDVRLAVRSLRRRPAFAAMATLILALGIGANSAIFSVVNAVLLQSLPYFDVLGARPAVGRTFRADEDTPGKGDVVILSHGLWQTVFGGDPGLVGRTIDLDGKPHTVVGVMKPDFYSAHLFSVQPGMWVPAPFAAQREDRTTRDGLVYGRLAEGRGIESAQVEMSAISAVSVEPPVQVGVFSAVRLSFPGTPDDQASAPSAVLRVVMPDYFETMSIPIVSGRAVTGDDTATSRRVAVISQSMARRYFADGNPIGRRFSVFGPRPQPMEVVGVAGDIITAGSDPTPQPMFYLPHAQSPLPVMSVVMRVPQGDANAPALQAEQIAWSLARDTNVYAVETMAQRMRDLYWRTRFSALLLGGFAALAVLLGAAGIYAVISYTVFQRRGEIGLRIALGARGADIARMVLASGLWPVIVGLAAGALAAVAATRALAGLLYGVAPGDPATLAAVAFVIIVVSTGACLGPAIRAMRVDPQTAMRG